MPKPYFDVSVEEKEFHEALKAIERAKNGLDAKYLKSVQRRKLRPMKQAMQRNMRRFSTRLVDMISITTAKKKAGPLGAKVGVVKEGTSEDFPDMTAPPLASMLEYGSAERYRNLRSLGFISGRQSTGSIDEPSTPPLRTAWDAHVSTFMKEVEDAIDKKIEKEFG